MKTKMFFVLALPIAFMAQSLIAKPTAFVESIRVTASQKHLKVDVAKAPEEIVEVTIEDTEGVVLYNDEMGKKATRKRYDLRNLPVGQYYLIVLKNRIKMVQPFIIQTNGIVISEQDRVDTPMPQVSFKGTKLDVRIFSSKSEKALLKIVDNQGITAFEETITGKSAAKRFDLKKLPKGVYFVELTVDSDFDSFTIQL